MLVLGLSATAVFALLAARGTATMRTEPHADAPHHAAPLLVRRHQFVAQVTCDDFRPSATRAYAARVLRRVAIRGGNGCGKSTLLQASPSA